VNPGNLYIVTANGLVASTDAGAHWRAITAPSSSRLTDLLVTAADGHSLLVGTEEGVFQTDNAGQTWNPSPLASTAGKTAGVAAPILLSSANGVTFATPTHSGENYEVYGVVGTEHNGFLAATSSGLMRSEGGESTWQPVPGILEGSTVSAICRHPTRPGTIFASKFGVIFISKDEGRSWTSLAEREDGTEVITELLIVPEIPDRIFALTRNRGVYAISLAAL
jgi:photosystem II stability/assembly factor-like uncharacterized protein